MAVCDERINRIIANFHTKLNNESLEIFDWLRLSSHLVLTFWSVNELFALRSVSQRAHVPFGGFFVTKSIARYRWWTTRRLTTIEKKWLRWRNHRFNKRLASHWKTIRSWQKSRLARDTINLDLPVASDPLGGELPKVVPCKLLP